jgi:hypothetical protein
LLSGHKELQRVHVSCDVWTCQWTWSVLKTDVRTRLIMSGHGLKQGVHLPYLVLTCLQTCLDHEPSLVVMLEHGGHITCLDVVQTQECMCPDFKYERLIRHETLIISTYTFYMSGRCHAKHMNFLFKGLVLLISFTSLKRKNFQQHSRRVERHCCVPSP